MDLVEEVLRYDLGKAGIMVFNCLVQPVECLVCLAMKGADVGDTIRSSLLGFRDQRGECCMGLGLAPSAW